MIYNCLKNYYTGTRTPFWQLIIIYIFNLLVKLITGYSRRVLVVSFDCCYQLYNGYEDGYF
jgi:hypothetical protein